MLKFQFDDIVYKNILAFLMKTSLTGSEVQEFNKVIYALSNPIEDELKTSVTENE